MTDLLSSVIAAQDLRYDTLTAPTRFIGGYRVRHAYNRHERRGCAFRAVIKKHLLEAIQSVRAERHWAALAGKLAAEASL